VLIVALPEVTVPPWGDAAAGSSPLVAASVTKATAQAPTGAARRRALRERVRWKRGLGTSIVFLRTSDAVGVSRGR